MGTSGKKQQRSAEQAEMERRRQIEQSTTAIDSIFDSPQRERQHRDFLESLRRLYRGDVEQRGKREGRKLKFSLARAGQTGGSVAGDAYSNFAREYQRGILDSDRRAQAQGADMRSRDEGKRLDLIDLAHRGADITTGRRRASEAMRAGIAADSRSLGTDALDDFFSGTSEIYRSQREAAGRRRAREILYGGV